MLLVVFAALLAPSAAHAGRKPVRKAAHAVKHRASRPLLAAMDMSLVRAKANLFAPRSTENAPLEPAFLKVAKPDTVYLSQLPPFRSEQSGSIVGIGPKGEAVFYTLNPELQDFTRRLISFARAPHVAIVAMDPRTGKTLAIGQKSTSIENVALHGGFPAASIFKLVTAAAALERSSICPESEIHFRGGNYTLNAWNYKPDRKRDKRKMTLADALGKSCNPVFARVALTALEPADLRGYAFGFGFNSSLFYDAALVPSRAVIPENDYELSRTAAGFGDVTLSPVHAAALMSGIANGGLLPRPALINRVVSKTGSVLYQNTPRALRRLVKPETAQKLLAMMEHTTTTGTSRREFMENNRRVLPVRVAGKTGTLRGKNPVGLNHWFVAAAPLEHPQIALAVIVVNPGNRHSKAAALGRLLLQKFFAL